MKAAVIQLSSTTNSQRCLQVAEKYLTQAAKQDCQLCVLPEMFSCLGPQAAVEKAQLPPEEIKNWARDLCQKLNIYLVSGSFLEPDGQSDKFFNTCQVYAPDGNCLASYHKIHLFDCQVPGAMYCESERVTPGNSTCHCSLGKSGQLGLAVCYDLRFPELFRSLVDKGAEFVALPAAFTEKTGRDHWEILLRARAIENQVYILAADQCGAPGKGLQRYGRSMIVDPWGLVLAQVADQEGLAIADLDLQHLRTLRETLPALKNRRSFT